MTISWIYTAMYVHNKNKWNNCSDDLMISFYYYHFTDMVPILCRLGIVIENIVRKLSVILFRSQCVNNNITPQE